MKATLYIVTALLIVSAAASVSYFLFTLGVGPFVLLPGGFQDFLLQNGWLRLAIPAVAIAALVARFVLSAAVKRREQQVRSA